VQLQVRALAGSPQRRPSYVRRCAGGESSLAARPLPLTKAPPCRRQAGAQAPSPPTAWWICGAPTISLKALRQRRTGAEPILILLNRAVSTLEGLPAAAHRSSRGRGLSALSMEWLSPADRAELERSSLQLVGFHGLDLPGGAAGPSVGFGSRRSPRKPTGFGLP